MGVEYKHYLLPVPRTKQLGALAASNFVQTLAAHNWIRTPASSHFANMESWNMPDVACATGACLREMSGYTRIPWPLTETWFADHADQDLWIDWPVGSLTCAGTRYPLQPKPDMPDEEIYYKLQLQMTVDYVHRMDELIEPMDSTQCSCGQQLAYLPDSRSDFFFSERIRARCPKCFLPFDPSIRAAIVQNGRTAVQKRVIGGATSRLALVIDCNKAIPDSSEILAHSELIQLCQDAWECDVEQVATYD